MGWSWKNALGGAVLGVPGAIIGGIAGDKIKNAIGGLADESDSAKAKRAAMESQAGKAGGFADAGEAEYGQLGAEAAAERERLRRLASGEDSLSREQLRQTLGQTLQAQRSLAAGASPANAAAAARQASLNAMRAQSGLAGQQAVAGIQERQAAANALAQFIAQQRQQAAQIGLGGRQTAIGGYGGVTPDKSWIEKWGPAIQGGIAAGAQAFSDERLKEDVEEMSDDDARKILGKLKGVSYDYKDEAHGKGRQVGAMAQNLQRAGLGHAVEDTPSGKVVHGAKLALGNIALLASLARRVDKLEGRGE